MSEVLVACPSCSFLNRQDGGEDKIVRPQYYRLQRAKLWTVLPCCALSTGLGRFECREHLAAAWRDRRDAAKTGELMTPLPDRARVTLERLEKRGL